MDHINIRFQVAAILLLTIIVFNYIRMEKLPLLSTRCFSVMMFFSIINLLFDFITIITINYSAMIPASISRICHQIFLGSLVGIVISLFFYVSSLGKKQKRLSKKDYIVCVVPAILAIFCILFAPIQYYHNSNIVYSYGLMTHSVYLVLIVYICMILISMSQNRNNFKKDQRFSIYAALVTCISATLIQTLHREILVSGLAISFMMCFILHRKHCLN